MRWIKIMSNDFLAVSITDARPSRVQRSENDCTRSERKVSFSLSLPPPSLYLSLSGLLSAGPPWSVRREPGERSAMQGEMEGSVVTGYHVISWGYNLGSAVEEKSNGPRS